METLASVRPSCAMDTCGLLFRVIALLVCGGVGRCSEFDDGSSVEEYRDKHSSCGKLLRIQQHGVLLLFFYLDCSCFFFFYSVLNLVRTIYPIVVFIISVFHYLSP